MNPSTYSTLVSPDQESTDDSNSECDTRLGSVETPGLLGYISVQLKRVDMETYIADLLEYCEGWKRSDEIVPFRAERSCEVEALPRVSLRVQTLTL